MTEKKRAELIAKLRRELNALGRGFDSVEQMDKADAGHGDLREVDA